MNRRHFVRLLSLGSASVLCGCSSLPHLHSLEKLFTHANSDQSETNDIAEVIAAPPAQPILTPEQMTEEFLKDARSRSLYFSQDFPEDILVHGRKFELMKSLVRKFRAVQRHVGHGNFNLLGMDEFFRLAQTASGAAEVTNEEKLFLEEMFYFDAKLYGFHGEKVFHKMTDIVKPGSTVKIPFTGHFLRRGEPVEIYNKIKKDVGNTVLVTSGVRALAKQYHLFFEKALETNGNMSKASRSLAPPGYSFHGQGDFDLGRKGYGYRNFTDDFAKTDEYRRLLDLGYVQIRYTHSNLLGVRFEPWHIKVPA